MEPNRHILVVENDGNIRNGLKALLEEEGYSVTCAENGREALHSLHDLEPPFVILLDLDMPIMNGWQFRQEQLQDPVLASIPVILLSGEPRLSQTAASLDAAADFAKPIDVDRLFAGIRLLDENRRGNTQAN